MEIKLIVSLRIAPGRRFVYGELNDLTIVDIEDVELFIVDRKLVTQVHYFTIRQHQENGKSVLDPKCNKSCSLEEFALLLVDNRAMQTSGYEEWGGR